MTRTLGVDDDLEPLAQAFLAASRPSFRPTPSTAWPRVPTWRTPALGWWRSKGRDLSQPSAIVCGSVAALLDAVLPDLPPAAAERAGRLLPGPLTLVLPNPGRRFAWLCGDAPERIGVRVPDLHRAGRHDRRGRGRAGDVGQSHGAAGAAPPGGRRPGAAGGRDRRRRRRCRGGVASTVVDVTGQEPAILREGPVGLDEVRRRLGLG